MSRGRYEVFEFQSTLSVRRATFFRHYRIPAQVISIHALREESDQTLRHIEDGHMISIHALREESDGGLREHHRDAFISIHALREESDFGFPFRLPFYYIFQSTLSVRRATRTAVIHACCKPISIHALREESDHELVDMQIPCQISIHALREESDTVICQWVFPTC